MDTVVVDLVVGEPAFEAGVAQIELVHHAAKRLSDALFVLARGAGIREQLASSVSFLAGGLLLGAAMARGLFGLMDEPDRPSQAQVATEFGMTENAVEQAFYRFRQRYQTLLREEIAHTVAMPGDVEDELRHLISVVRA